MHPNNKHKGRYDFERLRAAYPELNSYLSINKYGDETIDFANPDAVRTLNKALLKDYYAIQHWQIPQGYLCPPIPGRADYIHAISDLIGPKIGSAFTRGLDIGVGANCIYPIIGICEYNWRFVGADINPISIESAEKNISSNVALFGKVEFKLQQNPKNIFKGILEDFEDGTFDFTMCNPPFHSSKEEAVAGTKRKWKNLGKDKQHEKQIVNFGGQDPELWCEGGEIQFIETMIKESAEFKLRARWFTTLVSKEDSLKKLTSLLKSNLAKEIRILEMEQGQKKSRVLAWSFLTQSPT